MTTKKQNHLKFRAKLIKPINNSNSNFRIGDWIYWTMFDNFNYYKSIDKNTIGQSTCFLDKNNKEIYENDLLEYKDIHNSDIRIVSIKWNYKVGAFYTSRGDKLCDLIHTQTVYAKNNNFKECHPKIIGNIYDDPKLLI